MKHRWNKSKTCIRCGLTKREKQVNSVGGMAYSTDGFITFRFDAGDCIEVDQNEKYCPKCNQAKDKECFAKDNTKKDGLTACCKACRHKTTVAWGKLNPDIVRGYDRERSKTEKRKTYSRLRNRLWLQKNFSKLKFFLNLRGKCRQVIRTQNGKRGETIKYLGCTRAFWLKYLEEKFKPGMTWENYGKVWEVDHKNTHLQCR